MAGYGTVSLRERLVDAVRELRRRHVVRVFLVYVGVAVAVWQGADVAFAALGIPEWAVSLVVVLTALGLPVALVLAWAFDVTPQGVVRTTPSPEIDRTPDDDEARARWRRLQAVMDRVLAEPPEERERVLSSLDDPLDLIAEARDLLEAYERPGRAGELMDEIAETVARVPLGDVESGSMIGPYRVTGRLGSGGMGVVYRAVDDRLGRAIALKLLSPAYASDPVARERFLLEARAAATLDHPNICTILDLGEVDGRPFIAMPSYEGTTLAALLSRGPVEPERALDIAAQVGRALVAAHQQGIVHRDIKPANVIVTPEGTTKVLDFGVAKVASQRLTRTGANVGTPNYMSPEQTRGDVVDHRTDIWSLGVVLYEMTTGRRPFEGNNDQAIRTALLTSTPSMPEAGGVLARGLWAVIDRCLAKDRELRYASAEELVGDLEAIEVDPDAVDGSGPSASPGDEVIRRGERRPVTVLTCLVDGYGVLVEQMDSEALDSVTRQVHQAVAAAATAEGGMIHSLEPDRVVMVFGIPKAREDDVVRAVRCALGLQQQRWPAGWEGATHDVRLRVGVDRGMTPVLPSASGNGRLGIDRGLLDRASGVAGADRERSVLISEDCHRIVRAYFETEPGPELGLPGDAEPSRTYRVTAAKEYESSLEARGSSGLSAFAGREAEVRVLAETLRAACAGTGWIVTVEGDAGVGKSRLLYEFRRGVVGSSASVLTGRCQGYGGSVPYLPFLDVLRGLLLGDDAPPGEAAATVDRRLAELGSDLMRYAPFYHHLLSVPDRSALPPHLSGAQLRLAIVESITALLTVSCRDEPTVLLLEDWHWADDASVTTLRQLSALLASHRLMVVVTYRPGYAVDLGGIENRREIPLRPLDPDQSKAVVGSALGVDIVPDDLAAAIFARTQGNPFFTEEICTTLLEQGHVRSEQRRAVVSGSAADVPLPDSVQSTIRARLDRIDPTAREVLGAASVIGRDFTRELLEATLPEAAGVSLSLERLLGAGLIQQVRVVPDVTYRFRHALMQEVAYDTIPAHHTTKLQRRVGEGIEELFATEEPPLERLAGHFHEARAWEKAYRYGLAAARRAQRVSQFPEALHALDLAEGALRRLEASATPTALMDVLFLRERISETMGRRDEQQRLIDRLLPLARASGDVTLLTEALLRAGDLRLVMRQHDEAEALLLQAVEASEVEAGSTVHRKALRSLGLLRWHQDRNEEALEILEEVLEADRRDGDRDAICVDTHNLATVYRAMGHIERALELSEESFRLAEGNPLRECYARHAIALQQRMLGDAEGAIHGLEEAVAKCRDGKMPLQETFMLTSLAHFLLDQGRVEEGIERYREAVGLGRRIQAAEATAVAAAALGSVLEGLGQDREALEAWLEASEWAGKMRQTDQEIEASTRVASLGERLSRAQIAMEHWGRVRELGRLAEAPEVEVRALGGLARVTRRHLGGDAVAHPYYVEALTVSRRAGLPRHEGRILNTLGVIAWEAGDVEGARRRYEDAAECFERAGDDEGLGLALNSLGATLRRLGACGEAARVLEQAIEHHARRGARGMEGYALAVLGDVYCDVEQYGEGQEAYSRSLELRRLVGDRIGEGWMLERLARTAAATGNLDRLRELLEAAQVVADEQEAHDLLEACARLRR